MMKHRITKNNQIIFIKIVPGTTGNDYRLTAALTMFFKMAKFPTLTIKVPSQQLMSCLLKINGLCIISQTHLKCLCWMKKSLRIVYTTCLWAWGARYTVWSAPGMTSVMCGLHFLQLAPCLSAVSKPMEDTRVRLPYIGYLISYFDIKHIISNLLESDTCSSEASLLYYLACSYVYRKIGY